MSNNFTGKFKKADWVYFGRYVVGSLYYWLNQQWANNEVGKKRGLPAVKGEWLILDGHIFFLRRDYEKIAEAARKAIKKGDEKFFNTIADLSVEAVENVLAVSDKIQREKLSADLFAEFFKVIHEMQYPWIFMLPVVEVLEKTAVGKASGKKIKDDYLSSLLVLEKQTLVAQKDSEIAAIRSKIEKAGLKSKIKDLSAKDAMVLIKKVALDIYAEIKQHIKKYEWFGMMHFWGRSYKEKVFFEQLNAVAASPTQPSPFQRGRAPVRDNELLFLRRQIVELSYWRQHLAEVCAVASFKALAKFKEASRQMGLDYYSETVWLTPDEFLSGLRGVKIPRKLILKQRRAAVGLIVESGKIRAIVGDKLKALVDVFVERAASVERISGMTASAGKAAGKVKLIFTPDQMSKMKKGDVLVTMETTPDLLPAMYRACAIITDIGGITSHAAIVAREMKKPCIIGTKIATQVLKDGDLVEVDAEKGIVRIAGM